MITVVAFLALGNVLGANVRMGVKLMALLPVMSMVTIIGLSVAFIIAGLTKTPQDANATDTAAVSWPLYLVTGAMFPFAAFPDWLQESAPVHSLHRASNPNWPSEPSGQPTVLLVAATRAYRFVK